jgi:type II secretory pathway pseudopilin PulG
LCGIAMKKIRSHIKNNGSAGFSLLELAVLMVIVGLVTATTLETYNNYSKGMALRDTSARFYSIEVAMNQFLAKNGRLPCPAVPTDTPDAVSAGVEPVTCDTVPRNPIEAIPAVVGCVGGYCQSPGRDADDPVNGADLVLSGAVPYVTLGMTMKDSLDGWNRKIKYVVTAKLTQKDAYLTSAGAIDVVEHVGGGNALGDTMLPQTGQVVFLSHGQDGKGAYTFDGKLFAACPTSAAGFDFENCDEPSDATYFDNSDRSYVAGADYYDDVVSYAYKITALSDRWGYYGSSTEIQNSGGRRVGIGVNAPTNQLHVADNIKASSVQSDNFCDYGGVAMPTTGTVEEIGSYGKSGTNCLPPKVIGGTGISCPTAGTKGVAMTGIQNAGEVCATKNIPGNVITGECGAGEVMCGLTAAEGIRCRSIASAVCPP